MGGMMVSESTKKSTDNIFGFTRQTHYNHLAQCYKLTFNMYSLQTYVQTNFDLLPFLTASIIGAALNS